jgi:NADH-quinone oxidoreductase subunit J
MNAVSALLTPQTAATAAFVMVIGLTILGALIAVGARNIFHNVLGLCVSLFGVSGIFLFLNSPRRLMRSSSMSGPSVSPSALPSCCRAMYLPPAPQQSVRERQSAPAVSSSFGLLLKKTQWTAAPERSTDWSVTTIGHYFLTNYALIFELVSLLLLVAMLGAIVTARGDRSKP